MSIGHRVLRFKGEGRGVYNMYEVRYCHWLIWVFNIDILSHYSLQEAGRAPVTKVDGAVKLDVRRDDSQALQQILNVRYSL